MKVFESIAEWIVFRKTISDAKSIGFIPTMGCLHDGHRSLMRRSVSENDFSVLSIFVNGTQFADKSSCENYPKPIEDDLALAKREKIDAVILPKHVEMYADGFRYKVVEDSVSLVREGTYRPGHFTGVLTVILKFFTIVRPHKAYFGEKDYQQYELISGMKKAFFIDTDVVLCPVIRDKNGIALSSRNRMLNEEQMELVKHFPLILSSKEYTSEQVGLKLGELGFKVHYIEEANGRRYGSVQIGDISLIDNFVV